MISTVRVEYFKRFRDETFELTDAIVVAGPNNAGKSTLLQAVAVWGFAVQRWVQERGAKTSRARQRTGIPVSRRDFSAVPLRDMNLLWWNRDTAYSRAERPGVEAGAPKLVRVTASGTDSHGQTWDLGVTIRYTSREQVYIKLVDAAGSPVTDAPLGATEMQVVHVPPFSGIGPDEPFYDPGYQNLLIGQGKPGDILRNLLLEVAKDPADWRLLEQDVASIFQVELLPPNYTPGADPFIRVEYREAHSRSSRDTLDIASAGSGFHQVLALLAFFYARPAAMLLLDEPDAHQHVVLQRQVYDRLREVARLRGCQLLVATHSEVILDGTDARDVLSMYGGPHRLKFDSDRDRVREALRRLTTLDALNAESGLNILYVEDESDFKLLAAFARVLNHPAQQLFRVPFYLPLRGRRPAEAKAHFFAAKAVRNDVRGVVLLDGDNRDEPEHEIRTDGLIVLRWRRYEVESYLLHPESLMRYIEGPENPTLWGIAARRRAEEYLNNELPKAVISDPLGDHPFLQSEAASKTFLPRLFEAAEVDLRKADYYLVALGMKPSEVPAEVTEKFDAIVDALRTPAGVAPLLPPTAPPVPTAPAVVEAMKESDPA